MISPGSNVDGIIPKEWSKRAAQWLIYLSSQSEQEAEDSFDQDSLAVIRFAASRHDWQGLEMPHKWDVRSEKYNSRSLASSKAAMISAIKKWRSAGLKLDTEMGVVAAGGAGDTRDSDVHETMEEEVVATESTPALEQVSPRANNERLDHISNEEGASDEAAADSVRSFVTRLFDDHSSGMRIDQRDDLISALGSHPRMADNGQYDLLSGQTDVSPLQPPPPLATFHQRGETQTGSRSFQHPFPVQPQQTATSLPRDQSTFLFGGLDTRDRTLGSWNDMRLHASPLTPPQAYQHQTVHAPPTPRSLADPHRDGLGLRGWFRPQRLEEVLIMCRKAKRDASWSPRPQDDDGS
ncbi:hypothetical protein LIA77_11997 [Sarocladium implicatum]|nr:hypothetical protein LIA77_11997 [Sarocladium implicatum]